MSDDRFKKDIVRLYLGGCAGLVVFAAIMTAVVARSTGRCGPLIRQRLVAPDSAHEALVWGFDCGFATKGLTAVSVTEQGTAVPGFQPIVSFMDTTALHILTNRSVAPRVELEWAGPDTVVVHYEARARMMEGRPSAFGIVLRSEILQP